MIGPGIPADMGRIGYREWDIDEDTWISCEAFAGCAGVVHPAWTLNTMLEDHSLRVTRYVAGLLLAGRKEYSDDG